jgi:hypothetical protein
MCAVALYRTVPLAPHRPVEFRLNNRCHFPHHRVQINCSWAVFVAIIRRQNCHTGSIQLNAGLAQLSSACCLSLIIVISNIVAFAPRCITSRLGTEQWKWVQHMACSQQMECACSHLSRCRVVLLAFKSGTAWTHASAAAHFFENCFIKKQNLMRRFCLSGLALQHPKRSFFAQQHALCMDYVHSRCTKRAHALLMQFLFSNLGSALRK